MQKMFAFVVLFVVTLVFASPAHAQAAKKSGILCSAPPDAQLAAYPLMSGMLKSDEAERLGLHPEYLRYDFTAYNHHRELATAACPEPWVPEVIRAGTLVLVNDKHYVAYKHGCGNRLVYNGPIVPTKPTPAPPAATPAPRANNRGWLLRRWDAFWGWRPFLFGWGWGANIEVATTGSGNAEVVVDGIRIKTQGDAYVRIPVVPR